MEIGLGHLRMAPSTFWRYSMAEWLAAVDGYMESMGAEKSDPFSRDELERLMEDYPDDRHPT